MSGSLSPTAAYVDATGIHAPSYAEILAFLKGQMQAIYGSDIVVDNSAQDLQMIGIFALAISDTNAAAVAVYRSFSPSTAQGVGLSSNVKINGLARHLPTSSIAPLIIVGTVDTVITNGLVQDTPGNFWALPPSVTIPSPAGWVEVTATCLTPGAITAAPNDISRIYGPTITRGWQKAYNPEAAVPGEPVETDAQLRIRQSESTALPAQSVLAGIVGAVLAVPGVTHCVPYENDTNTDYTPPLPAPPAGVAPIKPHSISMVVRGTGNATTICQTILLKKTPGCFTVGTTRHVVADIYGLTHDIGYYIPVVVHIGVHITLKKKTGYSTLVADAISNTVAAYINELGSGEPVIYSKLFLPANLCDATNLPSPDAGDSYEITAMVIGTPPSPTFVGYSNVNIAIGLAQLAQCLVTDVVITAV
jgi:uncharacterized phage protein gp47/JayE